MMESIAYAVAGGALIGLAASWVLLGSGRIAGISGVLGGLVAPQPKAVSWRLNFLLGLVAGGLLLSFLTPGVFQVPTGRSLLAVGSAGLLVGVGTRLAQGCTSGHGVCGLSRFSTRSLAATLTFMATGFLTASLWGWFS